MSSANIVIAALVSTLIVVIFGMTTLCAKDVHSRGNAVWQPKKQQQPSRPTPQAPELDMGDLTKVSLDEAETAIRELKQNESLTLVFYAPRCPWCVKMVQTMNALLDQSEIIGNGIYMLEAGPDLQNAGGSVKDMLNFVKGLPTVFRLTKNNEEELKAAFFSGFSPPDKYREKIEEAPSINIKIKPQEPDADALEKMIK
jgi:hypothetical protein